MTSRSRSSTPFGFACIDAVPETPPCVPAVVTGPGPLILEDFISLYIWVRKANGGDNVRLLFMKHGGPGEVGYADLLLTSKSMAYKYPGGLANHSKIGYLLLMG